MFKIKFQHFGCAAILFTLCFAFGTTQAFAQAQGSTGQIAGAVRDSNGGAVVKASVKAINTQTALERSATSNEDGLFRFVLMPPGTYKVTAEASGFTKVTLDNVVVTVGQITDADLTIGVSGVAEAVTITAESLQTTVSQPDAFINQTAIDKLPINGRRFQDFVTLTPAAQVDTQRGQISLSGQRGINTNVNIDGMDYNQPFFGGIRGGERSNNAFTIPQESIREFQVVASGYSAEFGRSSGGVVTAVTKSGTNELHGSGFYLLRHRELATKNAFNQNAAPTQHQLGGSVGGPLKKDKIFFFGSYEQQFLTNPRAVLFNRLTTFTPTPATQEAFDFYKSLETPFDQTNDAIAFLGRVDYKFNDANTLNVRYNQSFNEALNANSVGNQLFPSTISALSNNGTEKDNTYTLVGQLNSFFRSTLVNELRAQYTRETRPRLANAQSPTVSTAIGKFGTVSFLPTTQFDWRFQVFNNLTWLKGNHTVKFGGEYNHLFIDQTFAFNQFGAFSISGTDTATHLDILSTPGNRFDTSTSSYLRQIGDGRLAFNMDEISFFVQDAWRVRPNLTLNLGLRWEGQFNPTPEATNTALVNQVRGFQFPSGHVVDPTFIPNNADQFGPRLGFAYDPFKNGKTVIRGFSGIYYARTPGLLLAAPLNNFRATPGDLSVRLPLPVTSLPVGAPGRTCTTVYCQLNLIGVNLNSFTLDKLPVLTVDQVQSVASALGLTTFNPFTGAQPITWASDYKNPKSYQFGGGIERELKNGFTVGVDYSQVNTFYLQRNRELNLPAPIIVPGDPAQRPFFGILAGGRARPIPTLGSIQVRESTARSVFQAMTVRGQMRRKWGQFNAFYTLSRSLSNDDNERDAGGVGYENGYLLASEFNYARLDRRHQFVANPIFFLPFGLEVSSAMRLLSGIPIDASYGSDVNESAGGADRPFSAAGVPFERNAFRNKPIYNVDFRAQKSIGFSESKKLILSADFFNLFNFDNVQLAGSTVTNYCAAPVPRDCGFGAPTNTNFLQLRGADGNFLTTNNPGAPFQAQFGLRLQF
ncbi:MAG: carboxypeptidase regulatory-like domain-containing protein [Acidobacteria bacterium]|nr:carboxypeptidase regulatory-like domain-containing protein [Acidobacteriota bacterium]